MEGCPASKSKQILQLSIELIGYQANRVEDINSLMPFNQTAYNLLGLIGPSQGLKAFMTK